MTRITVGRASPGRTSDESVAIHLKSERARLSPEQARWLAERLDEELALLDGGEIDVVDAVEAPEVSDDEREGIEQHPSEGMGGPEYRVGDTIPDESLDGESDASDDEDSDTPLDVECGVCGRGFDTEAGKNIHEGQMHDDGDDVRALDELLETQELGERRVELLAEAGFDTLVDIYDAPVDAIAIDGISESTATEISRFAAEQISESNDGEAGSESDGEDEDTDDADQDESAGDGEPILDHERIATAMDSIGIDDSVATGDVVHAVDVHNRPFQVASQLDIPRADADDLIGRLGLEDALDSKDGLAQQRFEGGESA